MATVHSIDGHQMSRLVAESGHVTHVDPVRCVRACPGVFNEWTGIHAHFKTRRQSINRRLRQSPVLSDNVPGF